MRKPIQPQQKGDSNAFLAHEDLKRTSLAQMKLVATGLFLTMVVVFLLVRVFEQDYTWLRWVGAFTEAAMVGALADWFAVTALFRHPLGIPIPHTAIIPLNKMRVAKTMGNFIQNNFLSEDVLAGKVKMLDIAGTLADWCSNEGNSHRLSRELVSTLPEIMKMLDDYEIQRFLNQNILDLVRETPLSPLCGHILKTFTSGNKHQEIINLLLPSIESLVEVHHQYIGRAIKEEMPWYVPGFVHDKVYHSIVKRVKDVFAEMNADPRHPLREKLLKSIDLLIEKLLSSPHYFSQGEEIKKWILSKAIIRDYLNRVWSEIKTLIIYDVQADNSRIQNAIERGIISIARGLQPDKQVKDQINQWLHITTRKVIQRHKDEIVTLISDTVSHWDTATIINKLELEVGRDLQYIRINGTIVGGLAGLLIYATSLFLR